MNRVMVIGRLVRDPELKYTQSNLAYCKFTLAVNRRFANKNGDRQADFINCVAWQKNAENLVKYLHKGNQLAIEGSIQTGSYQSQSGHKVYTVDVLVESLHFVDPIKKEQSNPYEGVYMKDLEQEDNVSPSDFDYSTSDSQQDAINERNNDADYSSFDLPF